MGKHLDRADILLDLDRYDLAESELRQEIAENPDSDLAHGSLARCLINQRKLGKDTLEIVEYALSLNPENDWLHYLLAVYWHMSCDFNRAQTAIAVAIELDPNSALYFDTLARILFDRGNDKFKTHSRRVLIVVFAMSRGTLWPIAWSILAVCKSYWVRSYLQPVFTPLAKSLSLDPEYLSAINLHTQLLIETNRSNRALTSSLNALETDPNDSTAHKLHGQVLLRLGQYTAAKDQLETSLSIDPSSNEAKADLLEAVRSQHWFYPWISNTNWRGRVVLLVTFAIVLAIAIWSFQASSPNISKTIFTIAIYAIFLPSLLVSFTAKYIWNLLLQIKPDRKLLISNLISLWEMVIGNYVASLVLALTGFIYLFGFSLIFFRYESINTMIRSILGVIAGIFISTVTCLPVTDLKQRKSAPVIYQLIIISLGVFNIALYLNGSNLTDAEGIFVGLVFLSPIFAINSSKKS